MHFFIKILIALLIVINFSPKALAQNPIRTNAIKQFCASEHGTSMRLRNICQIRQAKAVEKFMEIYETAPSHSDKWNRMRQCMTDHYDGANGFDWEEVLTCSRAKPTRKDNQEAAKK